MHSRRPLAHQEQHRMLPRRDEQSKSWPIVSHCHHHQACFRSSTSRLAGNQPQTQKHGVDQTLLAGGPHVKTERHLVAVKCSMCRVAPVESGSIEGNLAALSISFYPVPSSRALRGRFMPESVLLQCLRLTDASKKACVLLCHQQQPGQI